MQKLMRFLLLIAISTAASAVIGDGAGAANGKADGTIMHLHHMHTLMDHSLVMTLQGSDLLIQSKMKGAEPLAGITAPHARAMMAEAKQTLKDVLSGTEMKHAHEQGSWSDPLMGYTHELGAELLAVVDDLEKIDVSGESSAGRQVALNHALEMAAEGANLVMLGKMKMAGAVDQRTLSHGRKMLSDARTLWEKVLAAEGMTERGGALEPSPAARSFVRHGAKVLSLLESMSDLQY